ncbi:DUF1652 domain-containing protein [Pseudomonas typographi]|uniref:DUF1652 domain-containing protein n=1 Tax=Pseudomonas typographi TaxID=2715964 RepID=A0ABR7Z5S2_9PSED|nr:DUF1652 domain-containing protein [Pseudomonas typographi]MBD1554163.1 DUF1652 domain-containing protein [Pseudomonas typographi]MBD1589475.1 DUF1652 domain-containing protein [Pseudomonas typographi]MBD1600669.1 DUF1652 domain-containing protein [Pseudomonas typographi]
MKTIGLSPLELRNIIEHAFLPLQCVCAQAPDGTLTLRIENPANGRVELEEIGISTDRFASSREINNLVAQLRERLAAARPPQAKRLNHA